MIMQEIAKELGFPVDTIKKVVDSQSEFTKEVIESGTFDSVRWPYLGVFRSKPKEVQILNYLKGMTPEQQIDFKRDVRSGKFKIKYD